MKYSGTTRYRNMLGNSLPVGLAQQTKENDLKYLGCQTKKEYVMHIFLHKAFPGILQVRISSGMVCVNLNVSFFLISLKKPP